MQKESKSMLDLAWCHYLHVQRSGPLAVWVLLTLLTTSSLAEEPRGPTNDQPPSVNFEQLKQIGRSRSRYLAANATKQEHASTQAPEPQLAAFHAKIAPILKEHCFECHGSETQEGKLRIDTLDPNLHKGKDVEWWTEVFSAVSKGEMPPADSPSLPDAIDPS